MAFSQAGLRGQSFASASQLKLPSIQSSICPQPFCMQAFLIEESGKDQIEFVGNRTECALLVLLKNWGFSYKAIRDQQHSAVARVYGFTSERKMASALYAHQSGYRLYNKASIQAFPLWLQIHLPFWLNALEG